MTDSYSLVYKLMLKKSEDAVIFVSGLGLDIRQQREAFVRRFASRYNASYLALDCTNRAKAQTPFALMEKEAFDVVQTHFSKKRLFLTGACFGANIAMRLANRFSEQTKAVIILSPAINYSEPSIAKTIADRVERKKQACMKMNLKEQLQQVLIFQQLVEKMLPFVELQENQYKGLIQILHPQKDNFIPLNNSLNMVETLNRSNVSLNVLSNETHTLKNDHNLRLPLLMLEEIFQRCRDC